ncbi:MAG: MFS transporter [Acetobacteraceae bacterium]|nr:MFS transporter [Acetobacteraceae bacterium]
MASLATGALPSFTHQQILRVLSGILLCIFLAAIDQTVVIPAVPAMAAELNGFGHLSWIVSAYLLTATATTPIYGRLSDIYGRRFLLLPALLIFAVASACCALSQTLVQLIVARALQGIGGAGLMSMAQAAIADVVSPRERGKYQGYMASTWGIASVAGPIVGGWVTQAISWRWIFWMNLPIALLALILCDRSLRILARRAQKSVRIDYLGATLLTAAVSCWLVMLSWGGVEMPWTAPPIAILFLAGLLLGLVLVWQERRAPEPLLPPRLFANQVVVGGVLIGFFTALGLFGATFLLPLFFQLVRGFDAGASGFLVVPFLGSNCLGAFVAGQFARKLGRTKAILLAGLSGCVAGFLLLAALGPNTPLALTLIFQLVLGASVGLVMPSSLVMVQNAAERRDVGIATGTLLFLRSMGGAFGSTVVGALLASRFSQTLLEHGIHAELNLSEARGHGAAIAGLPPGIEAVISSGLVSGFHLAFLTCAGLLVLAVLITLRTRDLPLQSSADLGKEPTVLAH